MADPVTPGTEQEARLHEAIEGLRDEWREYQEQYERESNESVGWLARRYPRKEKP